MKITQVSHLFLEFFIFSRSLKAEEPLTEIRKLLIILTVKKGEELHLLAGYYLLNSRD